MTMPSIRPNAPRIVGRIRRRRRDERGDVPGWLMITMMTIAVGMVIFGIFQDWVGPFVESTLGQLEG